MPGTATLASKESTEVTNISPYGFWLLTGGREFFIDYDEYPVFESASILDIANVHADAIGNLHWPALDADVELDALLHPEAYPLAYR